MIVGGNIDGFTRVMTTAIALETSKGDLPLALALGAGAAGVVVLRPRIAACALARAGRWRRADASARTRPRHGGRVAPVTRLFSCTASICASAACRRWPGSTWRSGRRAGGADRRQRQRQEHPAAPAARAGAAFTAARSCARARCARPCCSSGRTCCARASANNVALALWLQGARWRHAQARGRRRARTGRAGRPRGAQRAHAVGRPAAAHGAGAGLGAASRRVAAGRADRQPGPHRQARGRGIDRRGAHGRTLVFASHNLGQVRLASRVVYLEHGRVLADLPVHDFFRTARRRGLRARPTCSSRANSSEWRWPRWFPLWGCSAGE